MDIDAPLVADRQASKAGEPSKGALHHPAMPAEPIARFNAASRNAMLDVAGRAGAPTSGVVIGLVGVQFLGSMPRAPAPPAAHRRNRIEHRLEAV
jgi:hypothetical protein